MSSKLAINGGTPTVPSELLIPWPQITQRDRELVSEVLDSGILAGAHSYQVKALQEEFAEYLGVNYCIAVNSGTAALHMAVAAAGVGPGDEVITSAFSFLASATAAMHQGAIPVFVDIDPKTHNLDVSQIESKISENTKGIIPVHIQGLPADMEEVLAIAKKYDLVVIEDACQAPGAEYRGRKVGTWGHSAAFSLNKSKNFPAGEGGLFVTNNREFWLKADMVRMFGEQVKEKERRTYVAHTLGWNYRMPELTAAIARAQLEKLDWVNAQGQENAAFLSEAISRLPGVEPPYCPPDRTHIYHKYRVRIHPEKLGFEGPSTELRDKLIIALQAEGVPAVLWQTFPLPANPLFQRKEGFGKGFPWSFPGARDVQYRVEDYPETVRLLNSSIVIGSERFPIWAQPREVVELWAAGIEKVLCNLDEVIATVELPEEEAFALGEVSKLKE